MNSFEIFYSILHVSEDLCKVWKCGFGSGVSYKNLSNVCNDCVHEFSFNRGGFIDKNKKKWAKRNPVLLFGNYFINRSRRLSLGYKVKYNLTWYRVNKSSSEVFVKY